MDWLLYPPAWDSWHRSAWLFQPVGLARFDLESLPVQPCETQGVGVGGKCILTWGLLGCGFFFLLLDVKSFSQFFSNCFCVVVANECLTGMERLY